MAALTFFVRIEELKVPNTVNSVLTALSGTSQKNFGTGDDPTVYFTVFYLMVASTKQS